uniref:Uncharacterized protein AlNc14C250G9631 n=1 Tax=Albugo laibachii Nc14 TaxID=890382 RepID=F0WTF2_9STRA|nr:conserved hypothetical protein [Albugo laibachii Nc14]|eukprot:CCA24642.1 conserved hypothetical protein [Albugo laibachii Nc14]
MFRADNVNVSESHVTSSTGCAAKDFHLGMNHEIMYSLEEDVLRLGNRDDDSRTHEMLHSTLDTKRKGSIRRILVILFVFGTLILLGLHLPVAVYVGAIVNWIGQHKLLGGVVILPFALIASVPLCLPSSLLEMLAGYIFGKLIGTLISLIGKTLGSILAFTLGRYYGRDSAGRYLETRYPMFDALSQTLQGSDWKPLIMFQLSSIPNVVKCYGLAITEVSWTRFAISTFLTGIPHSALWAIAGAQTIDMLKKRNSTQPSIKEWIVVIVGTLLTVAAIYILIRYTRSHLRRLNKNRMVHVAESETQVLISHERLVSHY